MSNRTHSESKFFAILLLFFICITSLSSFSVISEKFLCDESIYYVDGTQLNNQAKEFLANAYQISVDQITSYYCCKLTDGQYKYVCTIPTKITSVVFTVIQGQIIGGDEEGY